MLGYHASLRETSDGYMIEAVDPDAPIVMGQRILSRKLLRSGDRFTLGTTQFVFNEKVERPGEGLLQASGVETELPAIVGAAGSSPAAPDGQVVQPAVPAVVPKALVGTMGTFAGQRFELKPGETVIGRTEGDIVLGGDQQVSRHHAVITLEANRAFVVDPGSTNGTFISGARLQPGMQQPLSAGDSLQVGQSEFRLE